MSAVLLGNYHVIFYILSCNQSLCACACVCMKMCACIMHERMCVYMDVKQPTRKRFDLSRRHSRFSHAKYDEIVPLLKNSDLLINNVISHTCSWLINHITKVDKV